MSSGELLLPHNLGGPAVDLTNCEREPIHLPGSVQPHGALLVLTEPDLRIVQVSANTTDLLHLSPEELLNAPLNDFAENREVKALRRFLESEALQENPQYVFTLKFGERLVFDATAHRAQGFVIVELEPLDTSTSTADFQHATKNALTLLENAPDVPTLCDAAARAVRDLTGFDRVMIYRFAPDGSGEVVAEAQREDLHSFLGHRFPESDIPRQARALYLTNRLRLTANVLAPSVPLIPLLNPLTSAPLDMGRTVLRSTSPVHVQYLRNMGVASSLSVSVVQDGRLWGLIACHHTQPKFVPQGVRSACEFLGRVLALQLRAKREEETFRFREGLKQHTLRILDAAGSSLTPLAQLTRPDLNLVSYLRAGGAAVRFEGQLQLLGDTPAEQDVLAVAAWLREQGAPEYRTNALSREYPQAARFADVASGVLGISISGAWDEFVLWFRPEIPRSVTWGGDPRKPVEEGRAGEEQQLTPRRSFESYVQNVRETALPWHPGEVDEASALRVALADAAGERLSALRELNTRLQQVNARLERSNAELQRYAFVTAHDLQEPLRVMSNFLALFSRRYAGQLDAQADQLISFATGEASRLRTLIQDLYAYTVIGTETDGARVPVMLEAALHDAVSSLAPGAAEHLTVTHDALPVVEVNSGQLRHVLRHLLDNAIKFAGERDARVHVSAEREGPWWRVSVRDEGIGIAPQYHERVFEVFQRLHRLEEYSGSGIGLAICRKIIEHHGGRIWLESQLGAGSTFFFTLPAPADPRASGVTPHAE